MQWRSQGHCFGGQVASGEGILGGSAPNFYMELDFSNGLEHNWGGGGELNYATGAVVMPLHRQFETRENQNMASPTKRGFFSL